MFANKNLIELETPDVKLLQDSYDNNYCAVCNLAEETIQSVDLAMPKFNTLACLSKIDFYRIMCDVNRNHKPNQEFVVMVGILVDTLTSMIKNCAFYNEYMTGNTTILRSMITLLHKVYHVIYSYSVIEQNQVNTLIRLLEESSKRIIDQSDIYPTMMQIINLLKLKTKSDNKENKLAAKQICTPLKENDQIMKPKYSAPFMTSSINSNNEDKNINSKPSTSTMNNGTVNSNIKNYLNESKNVKQKHCAFFMNNNATSKNKRCSNLSSFKTITDNLSNEKANKPKNAFEYIMMASKHLQKKKKVI